LENNYSKWYNQSSHGETGLFSENQRMALSEEYNEILRDEKLILKKMIYMLFKVYRREVL